MKFKLCCFIVFVLLSCFANAQENREPHVCYPPTLNRSIKNNIDGYKNIAPNSIATGTVAYTQSVHNVIVKWESGSYSSYRVGTAPGLQDIRLGQSLSTSDKYTGGHSYEELRISSLALGTTFNLGNAFYITMDNGLGTEWVSPPLQFQWENLGDSSNNINIVVETNYGLGGFGPYTTAEEVKMMAFYDLVNPIVKDVFGPPSRNHDINIVNDAFASGVNIYYNGPNQVSSTFNLNAAGDLDQPRLMIHELIHAYRDNVGISSNTEWHYESLLNGFEEGMSEAIAIIVMDKFIGMYPSFFNGDEFKIHWNHSRGMPFSWDYDFQNNEQIRNKDYFSSDIATGSHWVRYGTGATAFRKMYIEDPEIFKKFNIEYYNRLNADHALIPNRDLVIDIFEGVTSEVERTPVRDWINEQKILDCETEIEKKVFMLTFTSLSWNSFTQDNRLFFLETHQNGLEWKWSSSDQAGVTEIDESAVSTEKWAWTHQLNNTPGQFKTIQDWDNAQYGTIKPIVNDYHGLYDGTNLSGPYQGANPYYSHDGLTFDSSGPFTRDLMQNQTYSVGSEIGKRALAMGSQKMYTSTSDNSNFWPTGIIPDRKITDLNQSGLYRWEIDFFDTAGATVQSSYFRLLGDDFIDIEGVFGGIYSDTKDLIEGKLIIEHENHGEEAEVIINNNSFKTIRTWASIPEVDVNRQGGRPDRQFSEPGKTHVIYISDDCSEHKIDFRTVGYGDGLDGVQMLLFKVDDFDDIIFTETASLSLCPDDEANFSVENNFPDILDDDSRISYQWLDPTGSIVSTAKDFNIMTITNADAGIYTLQINFFGCSISRTVELSIEDCSIDTDTDTGLNSNNIGPVLPSDTLTPNGDNENDFWNIENLEYQESNAIKVFNRWGVKVFDASNYKSGTWRGESTEGGSGLLPAGSYYYVIEYVTQNGIPKTITGWMYINY